MWAMRKCWMHRLKTWHLQHVARPLWDDGLIDQVCRFESRNRLLECAKPNIGWMGLYTWLNPIIPAIGKHQDTYIHTKVCTLVTVWFAHQSTGFSGPGYWNKYGDESNITRRTNSQSCGAMVCSKGFDFLYMLKNKGTITMSYWVSRKRNVSLLRIKTLAVLMEKNQMG